MEKKIDNLSEPVFVPTFILKNYKLFLSKQVHFIEGTMYV